MKLRLTPLNIVTALAFALLIVMLVQPKPTKPRLDDFSGLFQLILGAVIIVAFISDMIFRFTIKDLKWIWLVEMLLIALTIILFLILQK